MTLFVSDDEVDLRHESEPSYPFASLPLNGTRRAHLVAHFEPEGDLHDALDRRAAKPLEQVPERAVMPPGDYFYFWGHRSHGTRSLTGAQARPDER